MISSQSSDLEKFREELEDQAFHNIYPHPDWWLMTSSRCQRPRHSRDQNEIKTTFKGKPFHGANENVITFSDGRKKIHKTDQWPYSVHGVIEGRFNDDSFQGTGIMIGPDIVLTAGHNLYNFAEKAYADLESMRFKPAINGKMLPFGEVKVETYFVSPNYIKEEKEDFGILVLEEPIGEMTGYFGLSWLESEELIKKKVNITGYPDDKVQLKPKTFEMWGMGGSVDEIDEDQGLISYKIDTGEGQSGSGVVYERNGQYFVCGVHVKGGQNVNIATLLTRSRYKHIYKWIKEQKSKNLLVYLRNIERLIFFSRKRNKEWISLLLNENLENLTYLDLSESGIAANEVILLGQNSLWTHLSELHLYENEIGDEGAKGLGQNSSWIRLSELDLSRSMISDEGAKGLGQNTSWINLSKLNLSRNMISDEGAKGLGQNISWMNLSELNLSNNKIGDEGAKGLGQNISWINLSELNLSNNKIGDEGAKGLSQNTSWISLSGLDLSDNKIGDDGMKEFGQNTSWITLSKLNLFKNRVGDEGARRLGQNISWINLSELDLSNNNIGHKGAKGLGRNTSWINLSQLDLSNDPSFRQMKKIGKMCLFLNRPPKSNSSSMNKISDKGAKALAQNTSWIQLSKLNLSFNEIGDDGAQALAQYTSQINLSQLDLDGNKISGQGAKILGKSNIPMLSLTWNNISYENTRALSKQGFVSEYILSNFLFFGHLLLGISASELFSIWNVLEGSRAFEDLMIKFNSYYRSFIMRTKSPKEFENFVQKILHITHFGSDLNCSLPKPEENDELIEESDFNPESETLAFYGNQLCIEEDHTPTQSSFNLNLSSNHSSGDQVQPPPKNMFDHSS